MRRVRQDDVLLADRAASESPRSTRARLAESATRARHTRPARPAEREAERVIVATYPLKRTR